MLWVLKMIFLNTCSRSSRQILLFFCSHSFRDTTMAYHFCWNTKKAFYTLFVFIIRTSSAIFVCLLVFKNGEFLSRSACYTCPFCSDPFIQLPDLFIQLLRYLVISKEAVLGFFLAEMANFIVLRSGGQQTFGVSFEQLRNLSQRPSQQVSMKDRVLNFTDPTASIWPLSISITKSFISFLVL